MNTTNNVSNEYGSYCNKVQLKITKVINCNSVSKIFDVTFSITIDNAVRHSCTNFFTT